MNKQEEKRLKEEIEQAMLNDRNPYIVIHEIINIIIQHDKRERERLIKEIKDEIINTPISKFCDSDCTQDKILEIINKYKP